MISSGVLVGSCSMILVSLCVHRYRPAPGVSVYIMIYVSVDSLSRTVNAVITTRFADHATTDVLGLNINAQIAMFTRCHPYSMLIVALYLSFLNKKLVLLYQSLFKI